jgi:branched-chain amino acid transport system ATP-binding protein
MLKIEQLQVRYGHIHAIKGISLEVKEGETVALLGANGAGKSTVIRAIMGIIKLYKGNISHGKIYFKGKLLNNILANKILEEGISCVPEGRELFSRLTVLENLKMGAFTIKNRKLFKKRLDEVYEIFPVIAERKNQISGTLSGGEQQMLTIARSLMADPQLLILDEPSLGLAPILVERIFEVFYKLKKKKKTIFLVEQNASMALNFVDRGYILETGLIKTEGDSESLKNNDNVRKAYLGG